MQTIVILFGKFIDEMCQKTTTPHSAQVGKKLVEAYRSIHSFVRSFGVNDGAAGDGDGDACYNYVC